MHTIEIMEMAQAVAAELGYRIRHEYLGGAGGGVCEFGGRKWIFVDLALTATEQLDQLLEALQNDPRLCERDVPVVLRNHLGIRRAA